MTPRRGAPRKPDVAHRAGQSYRPDEWTAILAAARAAGLRPSEWIRATVVRASRGEQP